MIRDTKKWNIAVAMLSAFMQHVPSSINEECVHQYHRIVSLLEEAAGEDLSPFKIPDEKLQKEVTSFRPGGYRGGSSSVTYSKVRFCNSSYFSSQVHGVANFIPTLRDSSHKEISYDSLTDNQLREMLLNRRIKPKRIVNQRGESYVYDRAHAIASLLKDDKAETPASISNVYNINDSNFIHSSPGATITENTGLKNEELLKVIEGIKRPHVAEKLTAEDRAEIKIYVGTLELQANSRRPNDSIIKSSLESVRQIAETAAGTLLGEAALIAIKHYLSLPQRAAGPDSSSPPLLVLPVSSEQPKVLREEEHSSAIILLAYGWFEGTACKTLSTSSCSGSQTRRGTNERIREHREAISRLGHMPHSALQVAVSVGTGRYCVWRGGADEGFP